MWQNLRARLPFLFDPWSEELPPAPTLLHAMVAITIMAEAIGVSTAIFIAAGPKIFEIARAIVYGAGALLTFLIMGKFLRSRGVKASEIWNWKRTPSADESPTLTEFPLVAALACGIFAGGLLGLCAVGYRQLVLQLPSIQDMIRQHPELSVGPRQNLWWLALLAIVFAPLAEEYLFRGLLYRALDREWAGWRALIGSAAFFAIYHPPLSWLPVGMLGLLNACLFRQTRRLAPCVLSHMAYNAAVVLIR